MKAKKDKTSQPRQSEIQENNNLSGYPVYPANEDIYSQCREEKDVDPEDTSKSKESIEKDKVGALNEKDFSDDVSGSDLDMPGDELDYPKSPGMEDEENDYYSLGGDDHNDLEEDKGE